MQTEFQGYDKPVRKKYREILKDLRVESMLEVGCGSGVDYLGAKKTNPSIKYTGVDFTSGLIDYCRKTYQEGSFLQANIYELPFQSEMFDLVYCKDVLNHLDNWRNGFSELLRVSKKYVLVNFFDGLGSTTHKAKFMRNGYIDNFYDWNEVMTTLVSFNPESLTTYTIKCPPNNSEETMILFIKK